MSKTFKIALLFWAMFSAPAIAHNVEVAGDIAGTWHIEPDHNPRAGEPAKVWVALTRQGGEVLPLEKAICKLSIYSQPRTEDDRPVLQPSIKAIAVEQYQGIPGADVIFPAPGLYELELGCTPKIQGNFAAFKMQSEVTVAAGTAQGSPVPITAQSPASSMGTDHSAHANGGGQSHENSNRQKQILSGVIPIILGLGLLRFLSKRSPKA